MSDPGNPWLPRHAGARALLCDTGRALHGHAPDATGVAHRVGHAVALLARQAAEEERICGAALRAALPDLTARLWAEHDRLLADLAELDRPAAELVRAYDRFLPGYLIHLARKEDELWPAVRARFPADEVQAWRRGFAAALAHPRARPYLAWTAGSLDDDALGAVLRAVNDGSPPAVYATLAAHLRDALGEDRYAAAARRVGLGDHLALPYTATGAELTGPEEERNVRDVLRRRRLWRYEVTAERSYVGRFEAEAEALLGVRHVHATVSGSVALHLALLALGVGPGDEVIIPSVTWVGCADAVILCGAVPVPAAVDETLGLDPDDAARRFTDRTRAVMAASLYGNPCDAAGLRLLADRHGVPLLEDACQAAGVSFGGRRLGAWGDVGVFSTNLMKFVAAGDGGFLATGRDDVYAFAVAYTGGKTFPDRKRHLGLAAPVVPASTLRMSELTGAVALAQLRRLDGLLARLRAAAAEIRSRVGEGRSFRWAAGHDPAGAAGWQLPLVFADEAACQRFAAAVRARGVRHVSTVRERFAGAEIAHCYAAMAADQFIPTSGGHLATDFAAMVGRTPLDPRHDPWSHPRYRGDVRYPDGFMADTLALVRRLAMIQTNPRLTPAHCATIAAAVRAADDEVAADRPVSDGATIRGAETDGGTPSR